MHADIDTISGGFAPQWVDMMGFKAKYGQYTDIETLTQPGVGSTAAGTYLGNIGRGGVFFNPQSGVSIAQNKAEEANLAANYADVYKTGIRITGGFAWGMIGSTFAGNLGGAVLYGKWEYYCDVMEGMSYEEAAHDGFVKGATAFAVGHVVGTFGNGFIQGYTATTAGSAVADAAGVGTTTVVDNAAGGSVSDGVTTILGATKDTEPYFGTPGYNVLKLPNASDPAIWSWDPINLEWIKSAFIRQDVFRLVSDKFGYFTDQELKQLVYFNLRARANNPNAWQATVETLDGRIVDPAPLITNEPWKGPGPPPSGTINN